MKYFKRLRNWLTTLYSGWAIPQQLGIRESSAAEPVGEEPAKQHRAERLAPQVAARQTIDPEPRRSSEPSASPKIVEGTVQSTAVTSTPITSFREAAITDAVWVRPVAETRKNVSQEREDSTGASEQVSDQLLSPVSSSDDQLRPAVSGEEQTPKPDVSATDDAPVTDNKDSQRIETLQEAKPPVKEVAAPAQPVANRPPQNTKVPTQRPKELLPQVSSRAQEPVADNGGRTLPAQPKTSITVTTNAPRVAETEVVNKPLSTPVTKVQPNASVNPKPQQPNSKPHQPLVTAPVPPSARPKKADTTSTRELTSAPKKASSSQPFAAGKPASLPQKPTPAIKTPGKELDATDATPATAIARPKKPATGSKQSPPETVTPTQPAASSSKAPLPQPSASNSQAPQALSTNVKPQGENGAASGILSRRGKYDPGVINDQTALRLARLLVSEIKLYNMNKIEAAGAVNNIYDLLKDPIDKSRKHYQQRLGKTAIESMPDYFHSELVRALCEGDASRLGPNYQAPEE